MIWKKHLIMITILFFILFSSLFIYPSMAYSPAPTPIKCNYIIYDSEKNLSQISLEITKEGWILNWSKYDLFFYDLTEDYLINNTFQIQIPETIGTLAYGEIHYLNSSDVINKEWLNKTVYLLIQKSSGRRLWDSYSIIITKETINKNFTIIDDYDSGIDLDEWGNGWDPYNDSFFDTQFFCFILIPTYLFIITFIFLIYIINSDRKRKNKLKRYMIDSDRKKKLKSNKKIVICLNSINKKKKKNKNKLIALIILISQV